VDGVEKLPSISFAPFLSRKAHFKHFEGKIMTLFNTIATARRLGAFAVLAGGLISATLLAPQTAFAFDEASKSAINLTAEGLAIQGYDPVAYFTAGQPAKGDSQFSAQHEGATYLFTNAENRDAFLKEPAKYVPQFGGFCAMAAALEKKFDGDPNVWKIVDGKLYLNVNPDVGKRWQEDIPGNVNKANANWPKIKDKAPKEL
jgi:YHS domain-containing protein